MSKISININNHDQKYTVSEMRRRLAQVLSKLNGGQEVSFSFTATLENYRAAPTAHQIEAEENEPVLESYTSSSKPHKIYDNAFQRDTGFGIFITEAAARKFLNEGCQRHPDLYSQYEVRPAERNTAMPAVLGAPYDLSNTSAFDGDVYEQAGLWKYAHSMDADPIEATKDQYQIFADLHGITRSEARSHLLGHGYTFGGPVR